ncbi:sigma-54-dependent Fis family transcriptional regulator [Ktedonobacteria bacterium brp13]|nr:sigma-54-dependent Fis family transcriptional regulator [Ktedonobacteria bacterium brp13]
MVVGVFKPGTKISVQVPHYVEGDDPIAGLLVGQSSVMRDIVKIVRQIAQYPATTVLLQGESGTGKDVVARAIHRLSYPPHAPFIPINCAAIPETLLETELFGVEAGAFTDAKVSRDGYIARADQGTLFLDEVGSMPLVLQAKLLRFLETRTIRRVGGTREQHVQLRVISATNEDLPTAVADKLFREDLYYRLKVITIAMPPLHEHAEDIELLALHFLNEESLQRGTEIRLSAEALALLKQYSWPGNIRQLRGVIELACILCNDLLIQPVDLPDVIHDLQQVGRRTHAALLNIPQQIQLPSDGVDMPAFLMDIERVLIHQALERCDGNQVRAAALLGISRDQLRYRLLR